MPALDDMYVANQMMQAVKDVFVLCCYVLLILLESCIFFCALFILKSRLVV